MLQQLGEANRLEREADATTQIVYAWNGEREVVLETTRDLSAVLSKVRDRAFIGWRGNLLERDDYTERWQVHAIDLASLPAGFIDRR